MKENPATDVDRAALETVKKLGMAPVEVTLPDWPYDSLQLILFAEGAAAFEELTMQHGVDQLKMQTFDSWPNLFRQARFLSAVDFCPGRPHAEKSGARDDAHFLRRGSAAGAVAARRNVDHHEFYWTPSLTLRAGFVEVTQARSDLGARSRASAAKIFTGA